MELDTDAVELQLGMRFAAQFVQKAWHVWQPLGQLGPDRPTDGDLQLAYGLDAAVPERFADQTEVRRSVVRILQHDLVGFRAAESSLVERGEDRCVADSETAHA